MSGTGTTTIQQLLPQDNYNALIGANAPSAGNVYATIADLSGSGGIYGGSGSLTNPVSTTITGTSAQGLVFNVGAFTVNGLDGGAVQLTDTLTGLGTAELTLTGTGFGTGASLSYSDVVQAGGTQSIHFTGSLIVGGTGMIVTDSGDLRGLVYAADYQSQFVNESLITKRYADSLTQNTIYTADDSLTGNRIVDASGNNLTFDNVGTFKVENAASIIFDDTANIDFKIQRNANSLFEFTATSAFNATLKVGNGAKDGSAVLEAISSAGGFLMPRMNTTSEGNIASPATGLMIVNTTLNRARYYTGSSYESIAYLSDTINTYAESMTSILTDNSGAWVTRTIAGSPNKVIQVSICATPNNATVGTREFGSALGRLCLVDGDSSVTMLVQTDGTGQFEIFCDASGVSFDKIGELN